VLSVALTGNIASGKSTVGAVWAARGARVIEADALARLAVAPGTEVLEQIADRWGRDVLLPSGELDRSAIREIVFRDPDERLWLESVIHPVVGRLRAEEAAAEADAGADVVVSDIPLLFEGGLEDRFDLVVLVDAPEAVRRTRLIELRGLDPDSADRIIAAQMPSALKRDRADIIIDNVGSLADLERRAREIWTTIEERAEAEARG
jgi:dephospho-CoA kinase